MRYHHVNAFPPLSSRRLTKWDCKKAIPEQIGAPLYIITIQFNSQLALPRLSYWLFFLGFRLFICFWIMSITRCRCSNTCKRKKKCRYLFHFIHFAASTPKRAEVWLIQDYTKKPSLKITKKSRQFSNQ